MNSLKELRNKAREELILKYLRNPEKLVEDLMEGDTQIPRSDKLRQLLSDLDSAYVAYCYAYYVDKKPHKLTRQLACKSPNYAFWYARYIDKGYHKDTWAAVKEHRLMNSEYKKFVKGAGYLKSLSS